MGNDSLIYFETTRSKRGKQELQVARSARFTPVLQIATNKQQKTNKQTNKTNRQKKNTIWSNKQAKQKEDMNQERWF